LKQEFHIFKILEVFLQAHTILIKSVSSIYVQPFHFRSNSTNSIFMNLQNKSKICTELFLEQER
jgi:hypothetical protein